MSSQLINMISASFVETIIMVLISGGIGAAIGIPLGILLFITDRKSFLPMPKFHFVLSIIINATRSVPFIILLVAIIPFTRLVVGSSIGTAAAIVPLTISVAPFIARIVETSLREVDKGLVEAAQAMGATNLQIVGKVLLPEARPGILAGLTIAVVSLIGYSAMAGVVGGGGLGGIAFITAGVSVWKFEYGVAGFGFLALAVMIFGGWSPVKIALAAILFGFFRALGNVYSSFDFLLKLNMPSVVYNMLPYLVSLIVLAFTSKKSRAPKAEGIPYDKGQR